MLAGQVPAPVNGAGQGAAQAGQASRQFGQIRHHQLHRGAGGGGPPIGDKIGNGEIHFVTHRRDHRNGAAVDGPGHHLFVEGPQIFQGAAAPGQDDDLHPGDRGQVVQGPGDFPGGLGPLDLHRVNQHRHPGEALPQQAQEIFDRRPGGGGDQGDLLG